MKKTNFFTRKEISPLYIHSGQFLIFLFLLVVFVLAAQYFQNELYNVPSLWGFILLTLITPLSAKYLFQTFLSLREPLSSITKSNDAKWFENQKYFIFGLNPWSLVTTFCLVIGGNLTYFLVARGLWSGIADIAFILLESFLFGILGTLGWSFWALLLFAHRLRTLDIDLEPFDTKRDEFRKLSSSFLGMFGAGLMLYAGALIMGWLGVGAYIFYNPILKFWIFPFAITVIGFFILIQVFLHNVIKKAKLNRLNKISALIQKHYRDWEQQKSTSSQLDAINNLLNWKEKIEKEFEWPFDLLTFFSVIITVLLPTIKSITELFK